MPLASPNLFNAHALPADISEPHVQVGNHLRVNTHPSLGLPVAPFIVERAVIDNLKRLNLRTTAEFVDKHNNPLTPPFNVTPDNPVIARIVLAPGEMCLWAEVVAQSFDDLNTSGGSQPTPTPDRPRPGRPRPPIPPVPVPGGRLGVRGARVSSVGTSIRRRFDTRLLRVPRIDRFRRRFNFNFPRTLTCEAYVSSAMGPASIGQRRKVPFAFSAPGIVEIKITGWGRVARVNWIEASDRQPLKYHPFAILNLPHAGGMRYLPIQNAVARARARVNKQAPKRQPLQETVNTPVPNAAAIATITDERNRVKSLTTTLSGDLGKLINDPQSPFDQSITSNLRDENGNVIGQSSVARLHRVFQTQGDPGTASLLGYMLRDDDFVEIEEKIVFYRVSGFFKDRLDFGSGDKKTISSQLLDALLNRSNAGTKNWSRGNMIERFLGVLGNLNDVKLNTRLLDKFAEGDDYYAMGTTAIADRRAPLSGVAAPIITKTMHREWLPAVPPSAVRNVHAYVSGVRVAGLLAAGKKTPASGSGQVYSPLNKENAGGFHLPLMLSLSASPDGTIISAPGTGFVGDRTAGPGAIKYLVAQQDRFGRWSKWAARNAAPGPRPKPPIPHFQGFYTQPSIDDAASTGGDIYVKVMVPEPASLAPGSHLLDNLELTLKDETLIPLTVLNTAEATKAVDPSDPTAHILQIHHTGPILNATERRKMHITARWRDTSGVFSDVSTKQILTMTDPRPPAQIPVPDTLLYGARPDVTGLSNIEYRWTPQPSQANFGIYYTDENRLLSHLREIGETDLVDDLTSIDTDVSLADSVDARNAAVRAGIYRANAALFPDHVFERLRNVNVAFNSGEVGFRHKVSGSLRILNFYKIAAEAESGAKPVLTDLNMIIYGVPNSDPPPRPILSVKPVSPTDMEPDYVVEVSINLPAGVTAGESWRLRRSSVDAANPLRMPIAETGALGVMDAEKREQLAVYRDTGNVQIVDNVHLKPWIRYNWIADVQGAPESGSAASGQAVPGLWSRTSDPVSLVLIPAEAPAAPLIDTVTGTPSPDGLTDAVVNISLPVDTSVKGGAVGNFKMRISRRLSAQSRMSLLREADIFGDGPFAISGVDDKIPGDIVPSGAEYFVEIIDPVGRVGSTISHVVP